MPFILNLEEIIDKQEDQFHSIKLNNHKSVLKSVLKKLDFKLCELFDRHQEENRFSYQDLIR